MNPVLAYIEEGAYSECSVELKLEAWKLINLLYRSMFILEIATAIRVFVYFVKLLYLLKVDPLYLNESVKCSGWYC